MLSSIHSPGCHTCHVTHTEQSWVVKGLVPISSVGPMLYPIMYNSDHSMVCSGREGADEQVH